MRKLSFAAATCAIVAALAFGLSVSAVAQSGWLTQFQGLIPQYVEVGYENFDYNTGNLNTVGAPRWSGSTGARAYVSGNILQLSAPNSGAAATTAIWDIADLSAPSGKIVVGAGFWAGGGNKTTDWGPCGGVEVLDPAGNILGAINSYRANDNGSSYLWGQVGPTQGGAGPNAGPHANQTSRWQITSTPWLTWMTIDTNAKTINFSWSDGTTHDYGTFSYASFSSATAIGSIRIMCDTCVWSGSRPSVNLDSLTYGKYADPAAPEPSSLLAFATFGIGMVGLMRRRRA